MTLTRINANSITDGSIIDADINASAAIAGTKISPDFGSQTIQTTGVFSHAAGAVGTPSITFTGDLNTGIYSPAADTLAASTGGSERLRIDASGRVGIGKTPDATAFPVVGGLQLAGGANLFSWGNFGGTYLTANAFYNGTNWIYQANNASSVYIAADGTHVWLRASSGTAGNTATLLESARIDSSGRLLVGTSTGTGKVTIKTDNANNTAISNWDASHLVVTPGGGSNSGALAFGYNTSDNSSQIFSLEPGVAWRDINYRAGTNHRFYQAGATERVRFTDRVLCDVTTISALTSERRLKDKIDENAIDKNHAWEVAKNLPIRSFEYKNNPGSVNYGHIVDEIEAIDFSLVVPTGMSDEQGEIQTYDNVKLQAMYHVALQVALERIEQLEAKVAALEAS
jgi:hypothetical protein